jgi:hypothetical protein
MARSLGLRVVLVIGLVLASLQGRSAGAQTEEPTAATTPEITVELNKLEPVDAACRIYLLLRNETEITFETLQLELVSFDAQGIISQRVAVDLAPLRQGKTLVKLFDVPETPCESVEQLLLNETLQCDGGDGPIEDCLDLLHPSSRANVEFWK